MSTPNPWTSSKELLEMSCWISMARRLAMMDLRVALNGIVVLCCATTIGRCYKVGNFPASVSECWTRHDLVMSQQHVRNGRTIHTHYSFSSSAVNEIRFHGLHRRLLHSTLRDLTRPSQHPNQPHAMLQQAPTSDSRSFITLRCTETTMIHLMGLER